VISSWLLKVVIGIALVAAAVLELGSPLIARAQVDDAAHNIADEVAFRLDARNTQEELDDACREESEKESVEVITCTVDGEGRVQVTARKEARSFLLGKWSVTEDWYHPEASASADGPER
jgi:hypothetical protein